MTLLYQSEFFTSYQADRGRYFVFDLGNKRVKLSFCQLLAFRQKVKNINLEAHFTGENPHAMEILLLCNREHLFIFNTLEVVDLVQFIKGTFAMLELNSLVST